LVDLSIVGRSIVDRCRQVRLVAMVVTADRSFVESDSRRQSLPVTLLVALAMVVALLAPFAGIVYAASGAHATGTGMPVPVRPAGSTWWWFSIADEASPLTDTSPIGFGDPADHPVMIQHRGGVQALVFSLDTADPTGAVLSRGAGLVGGLAVGAVFFVLLPLLRSTARGILFTPGSATRLTVSAAIITVATALACLLPYLAAARFIGSPYGGERWVADLQIVWWPMPVAVLLLALAVTVRAGTVLTKDTEGLV
jgi:hypothetical protein